MGQLFASALSVAACGDTPVQPSPNHVVTPVASLVAGRPYRAVDLSPMQWAVAINASGQVAGVCETGSCLWHDGTVTYLGDMVVTVSFHFTDVLNDAGQVIGTCPTSQASVYHACLWDRGTLIDIDAASQVGNSYPNAINPAGTIVGTARLGGADHVFLWDHGTLTDLGEGSYGDLDRPVEINPRGQVVGFLDFARGGWIWERGVRTLLEGLEPGAITPAGRVVGIDWAAQPFARAFVSERGVQIGLPVLGNGGGESWALAINPAGQVIGHDWTSDAAVMWVRQP
jgi:probable HAF family extracellular repeat protein